MGCTSARPMHTPAQSRSLVMDLSEFGKVKEKNSCAPSADWEQNVLELFEEFLICKKFIVTL